MKAVKTMEELDKILERGQSDFRILLNGGCFSRKTIGKYGKKYDVFHSISDSYETMSKKKLLDSNIGEAMGKGAFIYEGQT